jgi:hypothetical protein
MPTDPSTAGLAGMFSAFLNAYDHGRELARKQRAQGAAGVFGGSPTGAAIPLESLFPKLSPDARGRAWGHADTLAAVVHGVAQHPYPERLGILKHLAPHLAQLGFTPDEIASFDPTDRSLSEILQSTDLVKHHCQGGDASASPRSNQP